MDSKILREYQEKSNNFDFTKFLSVLRIPIYLFQSSNNQISTIFFGIHIYQDYQKEEILFDLNFISNKEKELKWLVSFFILVMPLF